MPPGQPSFDLLIIDEASQVRPQDALGAVARCQQLVVVGDPKQLPPTSFFDVSSSDDDSNGIDNQTAILDWCWEKYPQYALNWHFRSAHQSLIAFSNREFYDEQLFVFPSTHADPAIRYHYLDHAVYSSGCNRAEAEAVALAVQQHFALTPHLSLGVATLNQSQQNLISEQIDKLCEDDELLAAAIRKTEQQPERFFVKNLETVQGDERDVMILSMVYGKDAEAGKVYQRFGPLISQGGWRRLNVLITRARQRMEVFTSILSEEVRVRKDSSRGVQAWHDYLSYLEQLGSQQTAVTVSDAAPLSEQAFLRQLAERLEAEGYRCVAELGVGQFRVDLAILDDGGKRYQLGLLCDGRYYHGQRTASDRDRLLEAQLQRQGWTLYRLWAVDWFRDWEGEWKRLVERVGLFKI